MNVLKLGIVAAAAVAIVAIMMVVALPLTLQATTPPTQPRISLTEVSFFTPGLCITSVCGYDDPYEVSFTLVNAGDADGFARVEFLIDEVVVMELEYLVMAGESEFHVEPVKVDDCFLHYADARLGDVRKA